MATAIFFGGRRINVPGAYSVVDATGVAATGIGPVGIVALIGTAEGGAPLSVETVDSDHTRPETALTRYRSGNLRTASQFAFQPANDDAVPGGAQRLVNVKVNPATQSTVTLLDDDGNDAIEVTSADYGAFTEQINIEVAAGTNQGKKVTIVFEDTEEEIDDIGGEAVFELTYTAGSSGYATAVGTVGASSFIGEGTKTSTGLDAQRSADIAAPGVIQVLSSSASDTTQSVVVYGRDGSGNAISETLALNGTSVVASTQSFASVFGGRLSATCVGTITVRSTVPTTLLTFAPATNTRGLVVGTNLPIVPASSTIAIDTGVATTYGIIVTENSAGQEVLQMLDFTATTAITLTGAGRKVKYLVLGDVPAARTVTLTARIFTLSYSTFSTVQKVVDALNALDGMVATAIVSNPTTFEMTDMDRVASSTSFHTTAGEWTADLFAVIDAVNDNSQLVTMERASGGSNGLIVPANTSAVYLTGGVEGTTTISEWQDAFTALKRRRVNIIVPLTNDPAVHELLRQHLVERAGRLKSEANGYVGIGTDDGEGETRSAIKSQIRALQTRHISALSQEFQRNDPDTGEAEWWPPYMLAVIAAGMQAGSAIGEPMTRKKPAVLAVRNDSSWTVQDDIEEMIDAGLMVAEQDDVTGVRFVRSITTHLADDNVIFGEMSANESANTAVYEFRRRLDKKVGNRALAGSVAALKGLASAVLQELVDDQIIVAWRALSIEQIGDSFPVSVDMAPVLPINFVPITVHLSSVRIAA